MNILEAKHIEYWFSFIRFVWAGTVVTFICFVLPIVLLLNGFLFFVPSHCDDSFVGFGIQLSMYTYVFPVARWIPFSCLIYSIFFGLNICAKRARASKMFWHWGFRRFCNWMLKCLSNVECKEEWITMFGFDLLHAVYCRLFAHMRSLPLESRAQYSHMRNNTKRKKEIFNRESIAAIQSEWNARTQLTAG